VGVSEGNSSTRGAVHAVRRRLIGKSDLIIGVCAGATTLLSGALIRLLLGLIPSEAIRGFFGVSPLHPLAGREDIVASFSIWFADAFLAPFWGVVTIHQREFGTVHRAGLSFGALLIFAATLWVVGWQVCRRVPPTLRQRSAVLLVTALVVATGVAVAAAALAPTWPTIEAATWSRPEGTVAFGPLSYFFGALAATLLLGAFCFGVVGLLPQPWAAALRRAGAFLGLCFLAGGLLFPVFSVSDNLPHASIAQGFGRASRFAAAAAGLDVPLALQAPVSLEQWCRLPWKNDNATSGAITVHWSKLAFSTGIAHPRGRLYQHAASLGVVGSLVGAALTLAVVGGLVLISWGLCRGAVARTTRRGLGLGVLQGGAVALLLLVTLWLSTTSAPAAGRRTGALPPSVSRSAW